MQDIWDNFEKIAVEQGLISLSEEDEKKDKKPSRSGLSEDAIRYLYGIEPDNIFTKKDIIDTAHPDTVVIVPAYDAMNGILENINQRHDIMTYIATKTPNGNISQRRYVVAKNELMNSLVKSAFALDNKNETELMILADSCAERLDKIKSTIHKEAWGPVATAALVAAVAVAGTWAWSYFGATSVQNVFANSQLVIEDLNALSSKPYASGIRKDVNNLMNAARQIYSLKDELTKTRSVDENLSLEQQKAEAERLQMINTKIGQYIEQLNKIYDVIPTWVNKIKIASSTSTDVKSDWWAKITEVFDYIHNTPEETLIDHLYGKDYMIGRFGGLYAAIKEDIKIMNESIKLATQSEPTIKESPTIKPAIETSVASKPIEKNKPEAYVAAPENKPNNITPPSVDSIFPEW